MTTLADRIQTSPAFATLSAAQIEIVAGCASEATFADGEMVFRADGDADAIHVLEHGRVALQLDPAAGPPLLIQTVGPTEVLGVSWMLPPYRWTLTAVVTMPAAAIRIDAQCLRDACDADAKLGYALHRSFAGIIRQRLVATRIQLLDVYSHHAE